MYETAVYRRQLVQKLTDFNVHQRPIVRQDTEFPGVVARPIGNTTALSLSLSAQLLDTAELTLARRIIG